MSTTTLQENFLEALSKSKLPVSVYLTNGIKLQGHIEDFDQYVLILNNSMAKQMVYKHAVSTVVPNISTSN